MMAGKTLMSGQNRSILLLLSPHIQIEDDLLNAMQCNGGGSGITLSVVRLVTHKLIVSVDAVVGVEILAITLAGKHMATLLPNFVLARYLQRLASFVTYITRVNPVSLLCFVLPH